MSTRKSVLIALLAFVCLTAFAAVGSAGAAASGSIAYEGEALTLHPASGQVVEGTTELEAGTDLVVRLRSSSGSTPFIRSAETVVGDDGGFEATFNLTGIEAGTEATAAVNANGTEVATAPVEIVEEPSPTPSPTETPGQPGFGIAVALVAVLVAVLSRDR